MGPLPQVIEREKWPVALQEIGDPARRAYLWGSLPPGPYVAIVGRRQPTPEATACAHRLAGELAKEGVTIVSGGALGIDTAAHRGALDVSGRTLVMAPVWLHKAYPTHNQQLFRDIVEGQGGYWTSAEPDVAPLNPAFFRRNEALAAIAQIVVVGEFAFRSGARNTVAHAARLGRPVFVLPSLYGNGGGAGSNALLDSGARPVLSSKDILRHLEQAGVYQNVAWWTTRSSRQERPAGPSPGGKRRPIDAPRPGRRAGDATPAPLPPSSPVLVAVASGATTVDEICRATGLSAAVVQHRILLHTLRGEVSEDDRGLLRYHPAPHVRT